MALTNNDNMVMPVTPMNNGGFFGGDASWLIIFLFAMMFGGWGGGFGGMGGFGGGMFPWLLAGQQQTNGIVSNGFDNAAIMSSINGVQNAVTSGFGDVQTALCSGFAGTTAAVRNAQSDISAQMYNNEIANLNRSFAEQTANAQGFNGVNNSIADVKYTIATEACNTRAANTQNTQAILDKLCQLELDGVKNQLAQAQRENVALQNAVNMGAFRESQTAQNAFIAQGLSNEVDALYNRLKNCPVPSQPVYGNQPIFTCNGNSGCGCGGSF